MNAKLIVNADDFGLTRGISEGILHCAAEGVVTATGILVNSENIEDRLKLIPPDAVLDAALTAF